MKEITITTQRELDALPAKFDEYTYIYIKSTERIIVRSARGNSNVEARGNSNVEARGNSNVVARGNSNVVAWENSNVEAWENSNVEAWENSNVVARGNSNVEARGNSNVEARGNSNVVAWENSNVEAWENSNVVARGNSNVVARGNSNVVAWENSNVVAWENSNVEAWENSNVVARGNSNVVAWENSNVVAWENSNVEAWENSNVVAWDTATVHLFALSTAFIYFFATVYVKSSTARVKRLYDKSTAKFCVDYSKDIIEDKQKTAQVVKQQKELSFETHLERGYVKADGIIQKLVSKKKAGSVQVFEVENFGKPNSFVIKKGDVFSHGETIELAKESLKYKISSRDTSEFKKWKVTDKRPVNDLIKAYRAITGACEFGTKQFCEQQKLKPKYTIKEIITMTAGQYGHEQFKEFFL